MLTRLRVLLARRGKLDCRIVNDALGVPRVSSYVKHFGSLRKAFALIGYVSPRDCDWIDTKEFWEGELSRHATRLADVMRTDLKLGAEIVHGGIGIAVGGKRRVTFLTARRLANRGPNHAPQWKLYRRGVSSGLLAVLRLDATNRVVDDYLLLPASLKAGWYVWLSAASLARHQAVRCGHLDDLIEIVKTRLAKFVRAARFQ